MTIPRRRTGTGRQPYRGGRHAPPRVPWTPAGTRLRGASVTTAAWMGKYGHRPRQIVRRARRGRYTARPRTSARLPLDAGAENSGGSLLGLALFGVQRWTEERLRGMMRGS